MKEWKQDKLIDILDALIDYRGKFLNVKYWAVQTKSEGNRHYRNGYQQSELKEVLIDYPNYEHQQQIASILSSLDDKIEQNRRINDNLNGISMKWLIFILFSLGVGPLFSQTLTKQQAIEDIDHYFQTIYAWHPNMYWHTPKSAIDSCMEEMKRKCYDSMPITELRYWLAHTNHFFDGHTGYGMRQYKPLWTEKVFPEIVFDNHKIYLKDNGLEISKINSVAVDSIFSLLRMNFGADVSMRWLESLISLTYEFQNAVNDFEIYSPYKISVKTKDHRDSTIVLEGISSRLLIGTHRFFVNDTKPYHFEQYPQEKIAIIRYDETFWKADYPEIDSLLNNFFKECHENRIKHLFFDVSRNGGGPSRQFAMFFPYIHMNKNRSYCRTLVSNVCNKPVERRDTINKKTVVPIKGVKPFKQNIYIYQSFYTQSAAPDFCACMKVLANAILVGTETGSGLPLYATTRTCYLPNSGSEFDVSQRYWKEEFPKLSRTSEGFLLPDIEYPLLMERRLNVEDCKKIIELNNEKN